MERLINWEQWRIIAISTVSPVLGYLTPTKGFVYALFPESETFYIRFASG